ncbi:glycosyltransferase family 39 protein [Singulisphaera sp. PoT]|uniref:glycosyltransferase family 39 protein n=1 Tax=Singulisphaera sp. PoT TaxID=3411797 RepID=UPI003BF4E45F
MTGRNWWLACAFLFAVLVAMFVPLAGDLGLTWDEPAYRYSQVKSAQWWERLSRVRSWEDLQPLVDSNSLLFYWQYGRHGINFHPPLAGQLNLATHALFGHWMKDIPSRRMASILEFALTLAIGFGFLSRRYSPWVGGVAAGSLLLMPRVFGEALLAETDTPGLLLWVATTIAFWKGLQEPNARRWRVLVGILLGLAFLEKMAAVTVILPLMAWLVLGRLPATILKKAGRVDWADGILTSTAMLVPLALTFREMMRLKLQLPAPKQTDLSVVHPQTILPGLILAVPLLVWVLRRGLAKIFRSSPLWGAERPALETWTAILAFAPVVSWLGNPAWWRETLPRLTHYYMLNTDRKGSLPDIQIMYAGKIYLFSLPWHNAWVLLTVTVPVGILVASFVGMIFSLVKLRRDHLPLYFLIHFLTLPVLRMLPTPAHDGVRLLLPTCFFLAAFAGWGVAWVGRGIDELNPMRPRLWRLVLTILVLGSAGWQLVRVHPYELSYYNEAIGGARKAWQAGFELSYWYDAINPSLIADINKKLPQNAAVELYNENDRTPTFLELQALGELRSDIVLGSPDPNALPYLCLLTHDSKAWSLLRLAFALKPWYASEPRQLDGARVASILDPVGVSRAMALWMLLDSREQERQPRVEVPAAVSEYAPWLARFWGQGLERLATKRPNDSIFAWAQNDPSGLRKAAESIAQSHGKDEGQDAQRLLAMLQRFDNPREPGGKFSERLLSARPQAIVEAVDMLIQHPNELRTVLMNQAYTDTATIGGYIDRDLKTTSTGSK